MAMKITNAVQDRTIGIVQKHYYLLQFTKILKVTLHQEK